MDLTNEISNIPLSQDVTHVNYGERDIPRIMAALAGLKPSRANDYREWLHVAFALKSAGDDLYPLFDCWSKQATNYGETKATWDSISPKQDGITLGSLFYWANQDAAEKQAPSDLTLVSATEYAAVCPTRPKPVILGLASEGDVWNVVAPPKHNKSFFIMQMMICVAAGIPFLGFETIKGPALLVDNELPHYFFWSRLRQMVAALGLDWDRVAPNIHVLLLRGKLATIDDIINVIKSKPGHFAIASIDTLYRTLRDVDENSNGEIAAVYSQLIETAERSRLALAVVHHTSKGSQANKSVSDLGSGAGAQSRSADVHSAILPHPGGDDLFNLHVIARSQPPIKPIVLRYTYPLWSVEPGIQPQTKTPNKKPEPTTNEFLETIPIQVTSKADVLRHSKALLNCSKAAIEALVRECQSRKLIEIEVPANKAKAHTIRRLAA